MELEARGEGKTGNKAWLRRRLHAAIVRGHLDEERRERHADLWGSDDSDQCPGSEFFARLRRAHELLTLLTF